MARIDASVTPWVMDSMAVPATETVMLLPLRDRRLPYGVSCCNATIGIRSKAVKSDVRALLCTTTRGGPMAETLQDTAPARIPLSRERVLRAAIALADEHG